MPRNIEIKARVNNLEDFKKLAKAASDQPEKILNQRDTFFNSEKGRLKLRVEDEKSELIFYVRSDQEGPKLSDYALYPTQDADTLRTVLSRTYGIRGEVVKKRTLFMCGQTRIHMDEVEGLGHFMELEVVLRDDQTIEEGQKIANDLMARLNVCESDLIEGAYMDLLDKLK